MSGVIESRLNAKLVRRRAEDRLELANEMKRRDMELARQVFDRWRRLASLPQQVASPAEAPESLVSQ
jgi:hypothetical protein